MALQTSGQISLNDIHVEAGGTTGTQASINDTDIRDLVSATASSEMQFSDWYGASAASFPNDIRQNFNKIEAKGLNAGKNSTATARITMTFGIGGTANSSLRSASFTGSQINQSNIWNATNGMTANIDIAGTSPNLYTGTNGYSWIEAGTMVEETIYTQYGHMPFQAAWVINKPNTVTNGMGNNTYNWTLGYLPRKVRYFKDNSVNTTITHSGKAGLYKWFEKGMNYTSSDLRVYFTLEDKGSWLSLVIGWFAQQAFPRGGDYNNPIADSFQGILGYGTSLTYENTAGHSGVYLHDYVQVGDIPLRDNGYYGLSGNEVYRSAGWIDYDGSFTEQPVNVTNHYSFKPWMTANERRGDTAANFDHKVVTGTGTEQ